MQVTEQKVFIKFINVNGHSKALIHTYLTKRYKPTVNINWPTGTTGYVAK